SAKIGAFQPYFSRCSQIRVCKSGEQSLYEIVKETCFIPTKKGPLGTIWIAAHLERKLRKNQVADTDIGVSVVGRNSSMLKMKPSPPVATQSTKRRRSTAPKTGVPKRKVLMDDNMVLHGDAIRQQLTNTEDIRRLRKKAPCTRSEISMLEKQFREDDVFSEPIFTGVSIKLASLHNQLYKLSKIVVPHNDVSLEGEKDPNPISQNDEKEKQLEVRANVSKENADFDPIAQPIELPIVTDNPVAQPIEPPMVTDNHTQDNNTASLDYYGSQPPQMGATEHMAEPFHPNPDLFGEKTAMEIDPKSFPDADIGVPVMPTEVERPTHVDVVPSNTFDMSAAMSEVQVDASLQTNAPGVSSTDKMDLQSVDMNIDSLNHLESNIAPETNIDVAPVKEVSEEKHDQDVEYRENEEAIVNEDAALASNVESSIHNSVYNGIFGEEYGTVAAYDTEVNPVSENVPLDEREVPGHHVTFETTEMNVEDIPTDNRVDDNELTHHAVENDTDFLNFDDDDDEADAGGDYAPDEEATRVIDNSGWSSRTKAVAKYLQIMFDKEGERGRNMLAVNNLLVGKTRKEASRMFFETLVLKTKDYIHVEQADPYENINIFPRAKLLKSDFYEALLKVKQAFRSTAVDLPPEESTAPYHSITLPETFDLDDFELPDNDLQGSYVDQHISSKDQITLQDTMEGVVYSTSKFGLDERFGDEASGLDLEEELLAEKAATPELAAGASNLDGDPQASVDADASDNLNEDLDDYDGDNEPVDYAQGPCTPGLWEEPNLANIQETSACDDHQEPENHAITESTVKGNLESVFPPEQHHNPFDSLEKSQPHVAETEQMFGSTPLRELLSTGAVIPVSNDPAKVEGLLNQNVRNEDPGFQTANDNHVNFVKYQGNQENTFHPTTELESNTDKDNLVGTPQHHMSFDPNNAATPVLFSHDSMPDSNFPSLRPCITFPNHETNAEGPYATEASNKNFQEINHAEYNQNPEVRVDNVIQREVHVESINNYSNNFSTPVNQREVQVENINSYANDYPAPEKRLSLPHWLSDVPKNFVPESTPIEKDITSGTKRSFTESSMTDQSLNLNESSGLFNTNTTAQSLNLNQSSDFLNFDDLDDDEADAGGDYGPDVEATRVIDNSGWSSRTKAVAKYLQIMFDKEGERGRNMLAVNNLLVGKTRKEASRMFFETLVLKTKDYIHVEQADPYENINIFPRAKLLKSDF
ncbi:hypothetical protein M8C21_005668, partial [Ambrosia artemisiifolia]